MNKYSVFCEQNVNLSTLAVRVLRFLSFTIQQAPVNLIMAVMLVFYSPFLLSALCFMSTYMTSASATTAMPIAV